MSSFEKNTGKPMLVINTTSKTLFSYNNNEGRSKCNTHKDYFPTTIMKAIFVCASYIYFCRGLVTFTVVLILVNNFPTVLVIMNLTVSKTKPHGHT